MNDLTLFWMVGEPMPPNLPDDILGGMGMATEPSGEAAEPEPEP